MRDLGNEGTPIAAAARLDTGRVAGTVSFTIPARALRDPHALTGARMYLKTWDYGGGHALGQQAQTQTQTQTQTASSGCGAGDAARWCCL